MEDGLIKITPDKEKAKSILRMAETTLNMAATIDIEKFPSNLAKEYYDIIRELISAVILLDGYKTHGEGAHKKVIDYLAEKYKQFSGHEIKTIDELRMTRNRISYDGFFVPPDYIKRKKEVLSTIIKKLTELLNNKLK
ncbi:MAG: hypothetical protein AABX75_00740 [Nanoarchaeota archaeon]